jgi:hypothetical protein
MSRKQRNLYVWGLDATSNIDVLKQHFERIGEVQTAFRINNVRLSIWTAFHSVFGRQPAPMTILYVSTSGAYSF